MLVNVTISNEYECTSRGKTSHQRNPTNWINADLYFLSMPYTLMLGIKFYAHIAHIRTLGVSMFDVGQWTSMQTRSGLFDFERRILIATCRDSNSKL